MKWYDLDQRILITLDWMNRWLWDTIGLDKIRVMRSTFITYIVLTVTATLISTGYLPTSLLVLTLLLLFVHALVERGERSNTANAFAMAYRLTPLFRFVRLMTPIIVAPHTLTTLSEGQLLPIIGSSLLIFNNFYVYSLKAEGPRRKRKKPAKTKAPVLQPASAGM